MKALESLMNAGAPEVDPAIEELGASQVKGV